VSAQDQPRHAEYVWFPDDNIKRNSNWAKFFRESNTGSYEDLATRADADADWFWDALIRHSGFRFIKPYSQVLDLSDGLPFAKWCIGATTNYTLSCLERNIEEGRGAKTFLVWQGEDGQERTWTYDDLVRETDRIVAALKALDIGRGDVVGLYMPLMPEAASAVLAVARIGGIIMPLFSGFGADAISTRLNDGDAKAVITVDGCYRRGRRIAMKPIMDDALTKVPSVKSVLVISRFGEMPDLAHGRDHALDDLVKGVAPASVAEELPADTPCMLVYTSGTTGKPKGTVHTHVSLPIKIFEDFQLCLDLKESDRMVWMTDMGWLIGPMQIISCALAGATVVMAEGAPDYPGPDRLWQLVEKYKITFLGLGPTLARVLMRHGEDIPAKFDLSSVRMAASTGEPWDDTSWFWVFEKVCGKRAPLMNYSGGTEMAGGLVVTNFLYPLKPGSFSGPVPGCGTDILDENGKSVSPGVMGELVMTKPCIGLTRGIWKSPERYMEYWERIPGVWVHGDWASRDADGAWYIHGRSDDTLKIGGKRTGPAEIESVLMATGRVSDAAVVGVPHPSSGSAIAIAVVPQANENDLALLADELARAIVAGHGTPFRPVRTLFVSELPKTRNMKTMRRLIRSALTGEPTGDLSALVNPEAFDELKAKAEHGA
jgi:acetyl-CoA synthetase